MSDRFRSFVVFAEMRTGSNFLEANLNNFAGITSHGEAFNPHFIGSPEQDRLLDVSRTERDENPVLLLDRLKEAPGLSGFRYFHDHDRRILPHIMGDAACAKIMLTRDPVPSYVSWKIARSTGQWLLTHADHRKTTQIRFDPDEFAQFLAQRETYRDTILQHLKTSGQTAFSLDYEDLSSVHNLNGLAAFLGVPDRLSKLDGRLKVQNPGSLRDKVSNFKEMQAFLAQRASDGLQDTPQNEGLRQAAVKSYVVADKASLLYMPIPGTPTKTVIAWLAALDEVAHNALQTGLSQSDLRRWKRAHPAHRSFTVVRHPVLRAHDFFCIHLRSPARGKYLFVRRTLTERYGAPPSDPAHCYDLDAHRAAFIAFLAFLDDNLRGRTALDIDPAWVSQAHIIQGFSRFAVPDIILREDDMTGGLCYLAQQARHEAPSTPVSCEATSPIGLDAIYDDEIEARAAHAYKRDYTDLGFSRWQ